MDTVNIVGGGIAGLSLANALHCSGIDFKLFEQAPQLTEVGAAIGISKAALDILEILGLGEQLKNAGSETRNLHLSDKNLKVIRVISPEWPSVIIHRAKLLDILTSKVPKEKIHLNTKLTSLKSEKDFSILKFSNGFEMNSSCTAIADGIQSKSREQIFPEIKIRYAEQAIWRGITTMHLPDQYIQTYTEIWSDSKRFEYFGVPDPGISLTTSPAPWAVRI